MSAYKIVVSKKTYSKTNVGDFVKVGKDNSGVMLYRKDAPMIKVNSVIKLGIMSKA